MARNHFVTAETENIPSDPRRENRAELSIGWSPTLLRPSRRGLTDHWKQKPVASRVFIVVAKSRCDYNGQGSACSLARSLARFCLRGAQSYSSKWFCVHDNKTELLQHSKQCISRGSYDFHFYSETFATPSAIMQRLFMQDLCTFVHVILILAFEKREEVR